MKMKITITETSGEKVIEDVTEITHAGAIALICCTMLRVLLMMDRGEAGITHTHRET